MDVAKLTSNLKTALIAQGIAFALSLMTSFIVPKLLGITEFGYWQLFLLYSSYVGFFHFGINDGVYLIHGGETREELDNGSIKSQFVLGIAGQSTIAVLIAAYCLLVVPDLDRVFVLIACCIFLIINNAAGFLGFVFQAINETKVFSHSLMLEKCSFLVELVFLVVLQVDVFQLYILGYVLSRFVALGYCLFKARTILSGDFIGIRLALTELFTSIKVGIKLTLSNVASMLIIGFGRFLIEGTWGIDSFGEVSFALSIVNFFIVFMSQLSMVLFPALRQSSKEELEKAFGILANLLNVLLPISFIAYYPICYLLSIWLPQYTQSFIYLAILLPLCIYNTKMDIQGTTYSKVLREEKLLLRTNIISVVSAILLGIIAAVFLRSIEAVVISMLLAVQFRAVFLETHFATKCKCNRSLQTISLLVISYLFIAIVLVFGTITGIPLVLVLLAFYYVVNRKSLAEVFAWIKERIATK